MKKDYNPYDRLVGFINIHRISSKEEQKLRGIIADIVKFKMSEVYDLLAPGGGSIAEDTTKIVLLKQFKKIINDDTP